MVRRIRLSGIVECILLQTVHLCRRISRAEEFRVEERVKRGSVDGRQVHNRVLNPRNYTVVVIYLTLEVRVEPPAGVHILLDRTASEFGGIVESRRDNILVFPVVLAVNNVDNLALERGRRLRDIGGVDGAGQSREVVVEEKFGGKRLASVVVVARSVVHPRSQDIVAVLGSLFKIKAFTIVGLDFFSSARTVPDSDLVDVTGEELADVLERFGIVVAILVDDIGHERRGGHILNRNIGSFDGSRGDKERRRNARVAGMFEAARRAGILGDHDHAVGGNEGRGGAGNLFTVDIER